MSSRSPYRTPLGSTRNSTTQGPHEKAARFLGGKGCPEYHTHALHHERNDSNGLLVIATSAYRGFSNYQNCLNCLAYEFAPQCPDREPTPEWEFRPDWVEHVV